MARTGSKDGTRWTLGAILAGIVLTQALVAAIAWVLAPGLL